MRATILAALMLMAATTAWAQASIYRCGPQGREFSQTPCSAHEISVAVSPRADARTASQVEEGREAQIRHDRLAHAVEQERVEAERTALKRGPRALTVTSASRHVDPFPTPAAGSRKRDQKDFVVRVPKGAAQSQRKKHARS